MRLYLRLLYFLKPHWKFVLFTILLMLVSSGIAIVPPIITKNIIDEIFAPPINQKAEVQKLLFVLYVYVSQLALVAAAQYFTDFLYFYFKAFVEQTVMHDFRNKIYRSIKALPDNFFDRQGVGDVMSRNIGDVEALGGFFQALLGIGREIVIIVGIIIVLFRMNWQMTVISIAVMLLLVPIVLRLALAVRRNFLLAREARGKLNHFLFSKLSPTDSDGTMVINQSEDAEIFDERSEMFKQHNITVAKLFAMLYAITGFVTVTTGGALWIYSGGQILSGQLTIGTLVALQQYISRLGKVVKSLSGDYVSIQRLSAPVQRAFEIVDLAVAVDSSYDSVHRNNIS